MNDFASQKDSVLAAIAANAATVLAGQTEYPLTSAQKTGLTASSSAFHVCLGNSQAAHAAAKSATAAKETAREALLASLASISASLYAPGSEVTPEDFEALGFAPRRSGSVRPKVAQAVAGLSAVPSADGSVALAWDRSGNSKSAIFQIEASADSGATWTIVGSTSRVSLTLDGFAPGAACWFRVVATTAKTAARPSYAVAIYGPQPNAAVRLKVA